MYDHWLNLNNSVWWFIQCPIADKSFLSFAAGTELKEHTDSNRWIQVAALAWEEYIYNFPTNIKWNEGSWWANNQKTSEPCVERYKDCWKQSYCHIRARCCNICMQKWRYIIVLLDNPLYDQLNALLTWKFLAGTQYESVNINCVESGRLMSVMHPKVKITSICYNDELKEIYIGTSRGKVQVWSVWDCDLTMSRCAPT